MSQIPPTSTATISIPEFLPGSRVTIFKVAITQRPYIEGRATIIAADPDFPGLYTVRFDGEVTPRERLVHGGEWQSNPKNQLRRLYNEWLVRMTPELLAAFFPGEFAKGGEGDE